MTLNKSILNSTTPLLLLARTVLWRFRLLVRVTLPKTVAYHLYFFRMANIGFAGLNLGCGGTRIKNFCNIDANPRSSCDVIGRVDKLKLAPGSVGSIYTSHVFEHIPRADAPRVLAEWYRVLKPGGRLYVCVPDQEVLFKVYVDNLPRYHTQEGKYLVDRACYLTYGGQTSKHDYHYYGYSYTTLKHLLESVGFRDIRRFDRGGVDLPLPNDISVAHVDTFAMSLNVEATKRSA
jgi:predicted SAM-dependent methyltransferase